MIALILSIALEIGIDGRLAVEIARKENHGLIADKVGISGDLGVMQLNPRYLDYFIKHYWDKRDVFNWKNPEHNIYVGLRHLKYLLSIPDFNEWQAIMAYNCGEAAVSSGAPPSSSIDYANEIYTRWKRTYN
ncbi:MAG: lytic transglycosylase domain-containing protein [Treponema sp.]|jgi:soluble lytic murein transglycosylase-like protein|nr:lytic transglycosylase domain-containing protein [Treponema sp.]